MPPCANHTSLLLCFWLEKSAFLISRGFVTLGQGDMIKYWHKISAVVSEGPAGPVLVPLCSPLCASYGHTMKARCGPFSRGL